MRAFAKWTYNWITVLVGLITGALAVLPDLITQALSFTDALGIGSIDLTVLGIDPMTAARITFGVAAAKGAHAWWLHARGVA